MHNHPELKLAKRKHSDYASDMSPNILIRNVPPSVHATLMARAEKEGMSLQEYLQGLLSDIASTPTMADIMAEIEIAMEDPTRPRFTSEEIVAMIRADRDANDWNS